MQSCEVNEGNLIAGSSPCLFHTPRVTILLTHSSTGVIKEKQTLRDDGESSYNFSNKAPGLVCLTEIDGRLAEGSVSMEDFHREMLNMQTVPPALVSPWYSGGFLCRWWHTRTRGVNRRAEKDS